MLLRFLLTGMDSLLQKLSINIPPPLFYKSNSGPVWLMKSQIVMLLQFSLVDDIAKTFSLCPVRQTVGCALIHTASHLLLHCFVHYISQLICQIRVIPLMIGAITRHSTPIQVSDRG